MVKQKKVTKQQKIIKKIKESSILKKEFDDMSDIKLEEGFVEAVRMVFEEGKTKDGTFQSKTEIDAPVAVSFYRMYAVWLESKGLKQSAMILNRFLDEYTVQMVSYKRKSRAEFIEALRAIADRTRIENQQKTIDRLTGKEGNQ